MNISHGNIIPFTGLRKKYFLLLQQIMIHEHVQSKTIPTIHFFISFTFCPLLNSSTLKTEKKNAFHLSLQLDPIYINIKHKIYVCRLL